MTSAGIDWQREKWQSGLGSKFIHQGEKNAAKYADEVKMHLSQNVVETFIDRIEVFNDERVKIRFTFEDVLAGYAE